MLLMVVWWHIRCTTFSGFQREIMKRSPESQMHVQLKHRAMDISCFKTQHVIRRHFAIPIIVASCIFLASNFPTSNATTITTVHDYFGNNSNDYHRDDEQTDSFVFSTNRLPLKLTLMPILANGHLGVTVFSDSIYMNGLYNGHHGFSHRARIPNYSNIQIKDCASHFSDHHRRNQEQRADDHCSNDDGGNCLYSLNTKRGYFTIQFNATGGGGDGNGIDADGAKSAGSSLSYRVQQYVYAHRYYSRAIVNLVIIKRDNYRGNITVKLLHNPGNQLSDDIQFYTISSWRSNNGERIEQRCGHTRLVEDLRLQPKQRKVCVLWNHVPEELTLDARKNIIAFKFVTTVDGDLRSARQEMIDALALKPRDLHSRHTDEWLKYWQSSNICVQNKFNLSRVILTSMYAIAASLPSLNTSRPNGQFFGLSPTGLGRGGSNLEDYQGHSFWDTETWMLPSILLFEPKWAKDLLHYRFTKLQAAKEFAQSTGFKGARFPWETAYTGRDVTQPDYPEVANNQIHISGDVSYAVYLYFAVTNDVAWMVTEGCSIATEIAKFYASRCDYDEGTGHFSIRSVMGPDEDHENVTNNVYTNAGAAFALKFGDFAGRICNMPFNNWTFIADNLIIPYDPIHDYHPQYENYTIGTPIKQADTILLGYPLSLQIPKTTRINDLRIYSNVTRDTGPAMTWSMYAINYLELNLIEQADRYLHLAYESYIRGPFYVWQEVKEEWDVTSSASNFITGAGGFLQLIINGYGGVRIRRDALEIAYPKMPPLSEALQIVGLKYRGIVFDLRVNMKSKMIGLRKIRAEGIRISVDGGTTNLYTNVQDIPFRDHVIFKP